MRQDVYHCEVVCDEQTSELELVLEILQEVQEPSLDRYVQSRGWLVSNEQVWGKGKGSSDTHALTLTTG